METNKQLYETLDELHAVVMRRFTSKTIQLKREKFYDDQIEKLRKKADKIIKK